MNKHNIPNQILPETRWVAALVIPFLTAAFVILFIFPGQTEALFAWKIQPTMSAMMLGATYAGGIYFFTNVLLSKKWHQIKVGFLPTNVFVLFLGIATVLHWDRFNQQHISFFAWAGLYFTTPFVILVVWLRNRSQDSGELDAPDAIIPYPVRLVMGAFGIITLLISLFLFLQPDAMIELWPWTLTPLTARVMGAMFALPGVVGISVAMDRRWSAARIMLQTQSFSILLILLSAFRARQEFDWAHPASWGFVGGLGVMVICILGLVAFMSAKNK